ncbi:MEG11-like protein, partial [Mya arenaria]
QAKFCRLDIPVTSGNTRPIVLCEVEIYGTEPDLIQRIYSEVEVTMGTAIKYAGINYTKMNAIDNKFSTSPDACGCCSGTDNDNWWHIDLGKKYLIQEIKIYGRTDGILEQNGPLVIKIGNDSSSLAAVQPISEGVKNSVLFQQPTIMRHLRVEKNTGQYMMICELKVFDKNCSRGHFGYSCLQENHCDSDYDMVTGHCLVCHAGWHGDACQQPCSFGKYGDQCMLNCSGHCLHNATCNHITGICTYGCEAGYNISDTRCRTECRGNTYGLNCSNSCGHCRNGHICDKMNGHCSNGCERGYNGSACKQTCSNGNFGYDCGARCHCSSAADTCNVFHGNCSNGCEYGWIGFNCTYDLNIIKPGQITASQSSTYKWCSADKSFDTKILHDATSEDNSLCAACSITNGTEEPWLKLDLGSEVLVDSVRVYGRNTIVEDGQSSFLSIYANNGSYLNENNWNYWTFLGVFNQSNFNDGLILHLDEPRLLRNIAVRKVTTIPAVMAVCEVKLYAKVCDSGNFGDKCSNECHCQDNITCNVVTGKCSSPRCLKGWKGEACNIKCSHGEYGENCLGSCNCFNAQNCSRDIGYCPGGKCEPGWKTPTCSQACDNGTFGHECHGKCHCFNNATCEPRSGRCPLQVCAPGWKGDNCSLQCDLQQFGQNCSSTCHCIIGTDCNKVDGLCSPPGKCEIGWRGDNCHKACGNGTFGHGCQGKCHCLNNATCEPRTGRCPLKVCAPGWKGYNCSLQCDLRQFGQNCSSTCHCINGTDCNKVDGLCSPPGKCEIGWRGDNCHKACGNGTFGHGCQGKCHCLNNATCEPRTGRCPLKVCAPGWKGDNCNLQCDLRQFGQNCSSTCHCINGTDCNKVDGLCSPPEKCDDGWRGDNCHKACGNGTFGHECQGKCHCLNNATCEPRTGRCPLQVCAPGWKGDNCSLRKGYDIFPPVQWSSTKKRNAIFDSLVRTVVQPVIVLMVPTVTRSTAFALHQESATMDGEETTVI